MKKENKNQKLDAKIEELENQRATEQKRLNNAERLEKIQIDRFRSIIKEKNIFYIADKNKFIMLNTKTGEVTHFKDAIGLYTLIGARDIKQKVFFEDALLLENRIKRRVVNTFNTSKEDELNFLSTDGWLKPKTGNPHPVFNILMKSLSGGDEKAQDHIEHVMAYKYLHPEDYRLPCISIFGEGGVGKNEFVTKVLAAIFGKSQVAVLSNREAFGQYNGLMLGKTVAFIDESVTDRSDHEAMKGKVGSSRININVKYGLAGEFDNTALYITGGNDESGSVIVKGDSTDRRWSIIHVERNIMEWIADEFKTVFDKNKTDEHNNETLTVWNEDLYPVLEDKDQVAMWLNYIVEKWKDASRPATFHGKAYQHLVEIQKSVQELCFEYVFNQPDFHHIELNDLYQVYLLMRVQNRGTNGGMPLGKGKFRAQTEKWLNTYKPNVVSDNINIKRPPENNKTSGRVFILGGDKVCSRNTFSYIRESEFGKKDLVDLNIQGDGRRQQEWTSRIIGMSG